jgi:hypothetical protein
MTSQDTPDNKTLEKVYQEASQWVRFANTVVWSMGTLLVPISFGFVGVALNNSGFSLIGKAILGAGSVFLFSFWVYASSFYKRSSDAARDVLIKIEEMWELDKREMSLYKSQKSILIRRFKPFEQHKFFRRFKKLYSLEIKSGLFRLQMITLVVLVIVWILIIYFKF